MVCKKMVRKKDFLFYRVYLDHSRYIYNIYTSVWGDFLSTNYKLIM